MSRDVELIRNAIREIVDPCSIGIGHPTNLVDMGIIDRLEWNGGKVVVTLVLTDPSCFFFKDIKRYITDVLLPMPGVDEVEIKLDPDKVWTPQLTGFPTSRTSLA